jgi:uncharacterized membrane protein (UPF0127 family)
VRPLIAIRLVALSLAVPFTACSHDHTATQITQPQDSTIAVAFPGGTITAKIAATAAARDQGLMNVTSLGANSGMLFAFSVDQSSPPEGFWMQNTPIPLSIAFIDANKTVINIDEMAAETTTLHFASRPFRYAVEANQGWMTSHNVVAGASVSFTLPAGTVIDP